MSEITTQDTNELVEFVMGNSVQPPENLDKMMTNLYQKLQMTLGYSMANNVKRQTKLVKFLELAESEIFDLDSETISQMDREELVKLYSQATKTLSDMNEFQRRFLAQNQNMAGEKTQTEELAQKLMALPPSKLESIKQIISGETAIENSLENDFDETV